MTANPRRALRLLGAVTLPVAIALAACQPAGATASPSEAMMDHSASPSEAMMEETASPSEAMMDHSASPSEAMMEETASPS